MTVALLDTCALVPSRARDVLLEVAGTGAYRPLWSAEILAELDRTGWFADDLPEDVWRVVVDEDREPIVLTMTGRDPETGRYVVLALEYPHTGPVIVVEDFEKILDDGLTAARARD